MKFQFAKEVLLLYKVINIKADSNKLTIEFSKKLTKQTFIVTPVDLSACVSVFRITSLYSVYSSVTISNVVI